MAETRWRTRHEVFPIRHTLLIAAVSILPLLAVAQTASTHPANLSSAALKELTPKGYKVEKTLACDEGQAAGREYLVALSDAADAEAFPEKSVMILLVAAGKKAALEDSVTLRHEGHAGVWGNPNFFSGMTKENVGGGDLFLVKSLESYGGSGSLHYFDFFRVEKKKLHLVKSFEHGRMEQTYFALFKNAIYDAEVVCKRGERRGKAFVYTCYLQVTKYTFDGQAIRPVGSERMREQQGNRYLQDKYRFISVLKALQKNEIFKP